MAIGRNWLTTLYPASYKGVPFETERDEEYGGRRIAIHEFPMRNTPFLEDLGEARREFEVTAYVASDAADRQAAEMIAVCAQRGPGVLVLPTHGPIFVRCLAFRRAREKDRAGKIALALRFVREGAAAALVSFASLANMVFVRADAVGVAVANYLVSAIVCLGQPDFVIEAATDALQDGAAIFENVRTTESVDTSASASQRVAIQGLFDAGPGAVSREDGVAASTVAQIVAIARGLGDGMDGRNAIRAFVPVIEQAAISPKEFYLSRAARTADANRLAVYLAIRIAAATAYAEGIARADIPDRQTAITLRADVAEHFEAILDAVSAKDADLYRAVMDLSGAVVDYLSRAILDRAPVVSANANRRMPSLWWAHRLYQDATRSTELAERNRVPHPGFMPTAFDALAR